MVSSNCQPEVESTAPPITQIEYAVENQVFIVEPIFKSDGEDTITSILKRLMQSERGTA